MSPSDVLKFAEKQGAKLVDLKFIDLPGIWQHTTVPIAQSERGLVRGRLRLRRLVDPRLAGDQRVRHAADPGSDDGDDGSVHAGPDAVAHLRHRRSRSRSEPYCARPAQHRAQGREVLEVDRHRRHRVTSAPKPSSSSSTTFATTQTPNQSFYFIDSDEGDAGTPAARSSAQPRLQAAHKGGYFPVAPTDTLVDTAHRDGA